ncbi:MAG: hypothetical protein O2968_09280 [Acidobacteria bacterium]|nr:hypothetical protein [Acidobacteriota bacterium]
MAKFPARIHVLLASHAPLGLVIRRGPSNSVATILWNRHRDSFELGQWLKGRIYERRCDLSPYGDYFIYFAMNGHWGSESKGSWTAVSRSPYLKALAMFPKGDCWHGGGLWTGRKDYWINDGYGHSVLRDTKEVRRDESFQPSEYFGGECTGVYYLRLLRDGWRLAERVKVTKWDRKDIFEKPLNHGWLLRKIANSGSGSPEGKGCYWDEHQLIHAKSGAEVDCPEWEWADVDGKSVVWARDGKLFRAGIKSSGLIAETELYDFNPMTFEAIEAPYCATCGLKDPKSASTSWRCTCGRYGTRRY